jgi:hypothetical protein
MRSLGLVILTAVIAGCGADRAPIPAACSGPVAPVQRAALRGAALSSDSLLSDCIAHAASDGALQAVATTFAAAGDDLAARAGRGDQQAAHGLGFLIGATQRGAEGNSAGAELANRLEADARRVHEVAPEMDALVTRGSTAGRARG